jgi:hypothetical protein
MKHGGVNRPVGQADARAQLVTILVLPHLIEAGAGIESQLVREPPFILHVHAAEPAEQHAGIVYGERDIGLDLVACGCVDRQQLRNVRDRRLLHARERAGAECVRLIQAESAIGLDAVDDAAAIHVAGDAIEHQVTDRIGRELNGGGSVEVGELEIDIAHRFLQREHAPLVPLHLRLVELRGVEAGDAEGSEAR